MHRSLDDIAVEATRKRRRQLIMVMLEVGLGDLVALDGVEKTRAVLTRFLEQLDV